jgi:hypothetical protein
MAMALAHRIEVGGEAMTDPRDLIKRLAKELDLYRQMARDNCTSTHPLAAEARAYFAQPEPDGPTELIRALELAEAALADIGDAEREPGDDLAWAEARAAQDLPRIRAVLARWGGPTQHGCTQLP